MNLPRLYTSSGEFVRIINPVSVSITLTMKPLSYATIRLLKDENLPIRGLVELFTPFGTAGIFRVRNPQDAYGDEMTTAELEHAIAEVGDYLVKEKTDEMLPAGTAMQRVFKYYKGSLWKLGSVSALGTGKIALKVNYNRVLDAMLAILEQKKDCMLSFDFSTKPWTVNVIKKGTTVEAEGRLSRNVTSAVVSYDDTEMCTRLYYQKFDSNPDGVWTYKDADTIGKYGVVEQEISTSADMTQEELNITVNTYLNEHKKPRVSVSINGTDLSKITGESLDRFAVGKMFRLTIPDYDFVLEDNIAELSWADVYNAPEDVSVLVGDSEDTVVTFLHNLDAKGGGGGGGGGGNKKEEEDKWKEYFTRIHQTDYSIRMNANKVDRANKILEQAGLDINSKGVLVYVKDKVNGIGSRIDQEASRINLVVSGRGKDAKLDVAKIVVGMNKQTGSFIKLKAKNIDLQGYVTASELNAQKARIDNLISGRSSAASLVCIALHTFSLNVGIYKATWQSVTIPNVGTIRYLGR